MNRGTELYLEVEDACVAVLEALSRGDHLGQELWVQSDGGSGCKKPAVTWQERLGLGEGGKRETEAPGEESLRGRGRGRDRAGGG